MGNDSLAGTLSRLDEIVDSSVSASSNLAIFPAMYRSVTRAVYTAVHEGGVFSDDAAVEHLTVVFADLYLDAFDGWERGRRPVECWAIAFEAAESRRRLMILQHLLLGMNAHINFDLGMATVAAAGDDGRLEPLYADFVLVNEILFQMLDRLQDGLGDVSPHMSRIDRLGLSWDETFMRVGIRSARDLAWRFAVHLTEAVDPAEVIGDRQRDTAWVARWMVRRWSPVSLVAGLIARGETTSVHDVVTALDCIEVDIGDAEKAAARTLEAVPETAVSFHTATRRRFPRRRRIT